MQWNVSAAITAAEILIQYAMYVECVTETNMDRTHGCSLEMRSSGDIL
jgi:hypothetical protein